MKLPQVKGMFAVAFLLVGCQTTSSLSSSPSGETSETSSESSSSCNCSIPSEEQTPYETIYQSEEVSKYPERAAKDIHKAADGYTGNSVQGYNGWAYVYKSGSTYEPLNFDETTHSWKQGNNEINGAFMTSSSMPVARAFTIFPGGTGKIYITGKVSLANEVEPSADVKILLNRTLIYPSSGSEQNIPEGDTNGFYHEVAVNVVPGDTIYFVVSGTGKVSWNPTIQYDGILESPLHYNPTGSFLNGNAIDLGDVHPYYHDGKMYMFYLRTDGGYNTALATSLNMIGYQDTTVSTHPVNPPGSNYYVLGITEEAGGFRTYYGASSSYIYGAKSNDLLTWEAGEGVDSLFNPTHLPTITYPAGGRDPYVFYDTDVQRYRIVYLGYYANKYRTGGDDFDAALSLQTSQGNSTEKWNAEEHELLRFDNEGTSGRDEPECPQIVKIGNRWYIFASIYGRSVNGVGLPSYWVGNANAKIDETDWNSKPELFLDGEDLCAAQLVKVGTRYYIYGWVAPYASGGGWGGALNIAREVYARADGTLATRLDPYMTKLLNGGSLYRLSQGNTTSVSGTWSTGTNQMTFSNGEPGPAGLNMSDYGELLLPGTYRRTMIEAKLSMPAGTRLAGFKLSQNGAPEYATVAVDKLNGRMIASAKDQAGYVTRAKFNTAISDYSDVSIKLIVEGALVEFYVNDTYALTARLFNDGTRSVLSDFSISLFGDGEGTSFSDLSVNMLRTTETAYD